MNKRLNRQSKDRNKRFFKNNLNKSLLTLFIISLFLQSHLANATKYEAEDANLIGVSTGNSVAGFSGTGYITANSFNDIGDRIVFTVNVPYDADFPLIIRYKNSINVEKYQYISINGGSKKHTHFPASASWTNLNYGKVPLKKGDNTIEISKSWGWTNIDCINVISGSDECNGSTYFVAPNGSDSNPGTQSKPFASMYKVGQVVHAGDVVIFEDGNYIEPKRVDFKTNAGTKDCPIIVKARNKHKAKIVFTTGAQGAQSIWITRPWITIEGFDLSKEVRGTTTSNQIIRIYGDTIRNDVGQIMDIRYGNYCTIRGNKIHHAYEEGVKSYQTKGLLIERNIIYDFIHEGIDFVDVDSAIIRNNEVYQVGRMAILGGKGGSKSIQVYNNYIHIDNEMPVAGYGISLGGSGTRTGVSCSNSIVYNNLIVSENSDYIYAGLAMFGTVNCAFYNNVVIGAKHGFYSRTFDDTPPNHNPVFKNNMIVNTTRDAYFHWDRTLDGTEDFDHNLFFKTSNPPNEANSVYEDPQFVDINSDWHLLPTSPAIDAGTDFKFTGYFGESIKLDRDWEREKRYAPWDIGIYEFPNLNQCNSTTYYVAPNGSDSNPGTLSQPFASMYKVGQIVRGGDVVIFEDGNYIEPRRVDFKANGGTKDCPIIVKARNKHQAKIVFTTGSQGAQSIWITSPWITIEGFDLSKEERGTTTSNQIIRIYGDTVYTIGGAPSHTNNGHYCTIRGNRIHHAYEEGVKSYQTKGLVVEDNIIYDFIHEGIDFVSVDDAIIRNNEIYQVGRMAILGGKGGSRSIQIYNNYIHINSEMPISGYGISLGGSVDASVTREGSCSNSIVYNNLIVSENSDYIYAGLVMFGTVNCAFYNNVVIGAKHGFYSRTLPNTPPNRNPVFKNNMIVNTTRNAYFHWDGTLDGTEDFDNNLFFKTSNPPSEPNSVYADPQFVDINSDWHLLPTSPAIDKGTEFTFTGYFGESIKLDLDWDGEKRSSLWDIGIHEQSTNNKETITNYNNGLLLTNYPNPFNQQTTVEFTLTNDSPVSLYISDVTGKQIKELLLNEVKQAGRNTFTFDANVYPSGIYYYSIRTPKHTHTQKMLIVR